MERSAGAISDRAVHAATGRSWSEWEALLDSWGASDLPHREIVALLRDRGGLDHGWWQQAVTVGYERLKGRRVPGQTRDTGFEVGVRRTLSLPAEEAWRLLTSPEGVGAWLGDAGGVRLEKGARYSLGDGTTGEVRVCRPGGHLRITWHPPAWARPSTLQIRATPRGARTEVSFHQEHLPGERERGERRAHFAAALDALERLARS